MRADKGPRPKRTARQTALLCNFTRLTFTTFNTLTPKLYPCTVRRARRSSRSFLSKIRAARNKRKYLVRERISVKQPTQKKNTRMRFSKCTTKKSYQIRKGTSICTHTRLHW